MSYPVLNTFQKSAKHHKPKPKNSYKLDDGIYKTCNKASPFLKPYKRPDTSIKSKGHLVKLLGQIN